MDEPAEMPRFWTKVTEISPTSCIRSTIHVGRPIAGRFLVTEAELHSLLIEAGYLPVSPDSPAPG